jgi:glycosyltransferase involved in cell wall biosynthesis
MKIAHFYNGIYFSGGVSSYILSLAKQQVAAGDEVLFFELTATTPLSGGIVPTLVENEETLFKICQEQAIDVLHYHKYAGLVPPAGLNAVYTVHEHTPHCLSGGLFLKRRQIPCPRTYNLLTCGYGHIRDHCGSLRPRRIVENIKRVHVQRAVTPKLKVICVGHFLKSRMLKSGYPEQNIKVIPNFTDIDVDHVAMPAGVPEFLFIGRLEKMKGVEWLLRSFEHTKAPYILNICGKGDEEPRLKALVKALHLEDRVNFPGWIDRERKISLLQSARAVIVPSVWHETFGLVAIEAASCFRPVIVSDAGELPYIVEDGHNGIVVPVGNIPALTDAIDALAGDAGKATQMGIANQQKYRELYSPAVHKRQIDEIYASSLVTI